MKIAIVAHLKYPIAEPYSGGLEMHTHLLAYKLAERGHVVSLFASDGSDGPNVIHMGRPTAALERDPVQAMTITSVEHAAYTEIIGHLQNGSFDIVHFNALHYLPLIHSRDINAKMVAVLHTPPFLPLEAAMRTASVGAVCISVSTSMARQWTGLASPAIVVENGIDLERFAFSATPDREPFAFWFGRIVPEKGLHLAIDAARAASIPLRFAGPALDPHYWADEIAPRLGGTAIYLGHLLQKDIVDVLGRASVLLCTPRWEEPFGLVAVEALACGTPVAAFARGALLEIVDETCGALARADDVEDLATAIAYCLRLDRRACRIRAERCYDAERMVDRYEEIYRHTLSAAAVNSGTDDVASVA
jgi:UDP-glucose:tetrahydrobiopterin glucosyltransferase